MASGLDLTPLISATYPLEKAMEAIEFARTKGTMKVQIRVCSDEVACKDCGEAAGAAKLPRVS